MADEDRFLAAEEKFLQELPEDYPGDDEEHMVMGEVPWTEPVKRKKIQKKAGTLADAVSDCVYENGIDIIFQEDDETLEDYLIARSVNLMERKYICNIVQSGLVETIVDRINEGSDGIPGRREVIQNKGDTRLSNDRLYEITKEFVIGLRQGLLRSKERFGKKICNTFKEMRRKFAEANGIDYSEDDCTNPEPCKGTCPYCEGKNKELLEKADELSRTQEIVYPTFQIEKPNCTASAMTSDISSNTDETDTLVLDMGQMPVDPDPADIW